VVTAVIAAAGSGERLGAGGPKAFVPLAGKPMVEWSIEAFRACDLVRSIVVAVPPGHGRDQGFDDEITVVEGGATRACSVANGLEVVDTGLVAVHDAARPLLTSDLVEELVAALDAAPEAAGAIAAVPVTDTLKQVAVTTTPAFPVAGEENAGLVVDRTLDRSQFWAAQTPQVFRTDVLREALAVDTEARDTATDEASLVEAAGGTVLIHPTPAENLKVTTPLDLEIAELLLSRRLSGSRTGPPPLG
jgi:2-C-methyl-D-erythritol 4-phosphate cytidylyltransferase